MSDEIKSTCTCAAYACPMPGVMTQSTVGSNEWFCWLHFGKESVHWQAITAELQRLVWLVDAIQTMRRDYGSDRWPDAYRSALQAIRSNGRKDLEKLQAESVHGWLLRLDNELGRACSEVTRAPVKQARIAQQQDTWQKVGFEVPEPA